MIGIMNDLHKLYPGSLPDIPMSKMKETTLDKKLAYFCKVLKSIRDSWTKSDELIAKFRYYRSGNMEISSVEQLVDMVFATLDCVIKAARELFDLTDEEELKEDRPQASTLTSKKAHGSAKAEEPASIPHSPSQGAQDSSPLNKEDTIEKSKTDAKEVMSNSIVTPTVSDKKIECNQDTGLKPKSANSSINEVTSEKGKGDKTNETGKPGTAPPPMVPSKGSVKSAPSLPMPAKGSVPTPMPLKKGPGPPPPPPLGAGKSLLQKKATTKLKRSIQMSNLFHNLKEKMEGSTLAVRSANGRKKQLGGSAGGKQGLADSITELTKRSPYFQQIEEDSQKHAKSIMELKIAINSFQTKDMIKLLKFQKNAESLLEVLTDETQVLAKFEDFPTIKLETLRTATAQYIKLDTIVTNLKKWEIVPPLGQLLYKIEYYFSKVKAELDAFERIKDEESKKFKSYSIDFDFNIITRIKELMVDVSSRCMELALQERREAKAAVANEETGSKTDGQRKDSAKILWKAFQLAFRVYCFAGGQDDRADKLARELANEILIDSPNQ